VHRLRELARTTFIVLKDCSGTVQCVAEPEMVKQIGLRLDEPIEVGGQLVRDQRAAGGLEIKVLELHRFNEVAGPLPFSSASDLSELGLDTILNNRALSLRNDQVADVIKVQAAILQLFRQYLQAQHFTEIMTSKIVSSGTEGGTNLFEIKYFERTAYLAQSPQFYKEQAVAGLERVFETGHVYRAEPHATSRHLTEYYSLDLEFGFIDGPEEVIALEQSLLDFVFAGLNEKHLELLKRFGRSKLPSMQEVPIWDFEDCLRRLADKFGRRDLLDDLDPEAERQLCQIAEEENGIAAVFVLAFPLSARPFYTHPRGAGGQAQSFDLLFEGLEITTGGQRLHKRKDLEAALSRRGIDPATFESHLRIFDMGMPPHGGLAIGLERLTTKILNLANVRQATLFPRDRYRLAP
jgi:nondiscriminating aspartyl-tRNA synthetase